MRRSDTHMLPPFFASHGVLAGVSHPVAPGLRVAMCGSTILDTRYIIAQTDSVVQCCKKGSQTRSSSPVGMWARGHVSGDLSQLSQPSSLAWTSQRDRSTRVRLGVMPYQVYSCCYCCCCVRSMYLLHRKKKKKNIYLVYE